MIDLVQFLILTLGVYRIAHAITREDGPFNVFLKLRGWVGLPSRGWLAAGFHCILCVSFWTAALFALVLALPWWWWLGLAGGAEMIDTWERLK